MKLSLAYYGDPVLRKKAAPIQEINEEIRQLIQDMIETMELENGIGLAAPQVHRSLALFVMRVPIQQPDETWSPGLIRVFINPKIIWYSQEGEFDVEGCLSIPKIYGNVERPLSIRIEALDGEGNAFTEELSGLEARCALHENDHLNGVLYFDRVKGKERQEIEKKLREWKKKSQKPSPKKPR